MTRFAVVDLETTGHTPTKGDKIIEVGIVIVEDGAIIDQYASYVNPNQEIPPFISNLTGITDEEVKDAPSFHEIASVIREKCDNAYFVAHHVQFDLGFLNEAFLQEGLAPLKGKVIDTVELARIFAPRAFGYKLSQLAEYFSITHKHPHRALSDAYVTAELLIKLFEKASQLPFETLEHLMILESKMHSDLYPLLSDWMQEKRYDMEENESIEVYRGIALRKLLEEPQHEHKIKGSFGEFLDTTFGKNGALQTVMQNFEPRESQQEMSESIYAVFHEKKHALIEAETGTGKTLAYLLPSIYYALQEDERVLISTYTTQLQAQLLEKEIPLLKRLFPDMFEAVMIKGKSHYLSLKRFEQEIMKSPAQDNYDVILTKALLLVWLTETATGDVDELQLPSSGQFFWRKINAEAEGIPDPHSPWFHRTFFQKVKRKAQKSNLIITNHALLCADIMNDYQLLPTYKFAIIDEAHHLDKTASKHFGMQVDYVSVQFMLNDLSDLKINFVTKFEEDLLTKAKECTDELFRYLYQIVAHQKNSEKTFNDIGRIQYVFESEQLDDRTKELIKDLASRLIFVLKDLLVLLDKRVETEEDDGKKEDLIRKINQIEKVIQQINIFLINKDTNLVKWIEIEGQGAKNAVYLYCEPMEIGPLLHENFYARKKSVVLTSATLTMKGSFQYLLDRNGLDEKEVETKIIESPFSYKDQVQLLVPSDLPNIKYDTEEDYIANISYAIYELAKITSGRMLVLFTSYQMLKKTYEMLRDFTDQDDFIIIAQGVSSGSRTRLKKNFQSFDQAILLGTSSFWEGVDIPGEDLSAVVIVRLPFEPPNHPVFSTRANALKDQGRNPFMDLALPNAVIRFKQGFGRLIRSSKDRGIVLVCDGRLMKSKYGKYFTDSIPKVPIVYDEIHKLLDHANEWF
ncbi:ATP-dependent DNA helicase DinG [Salirhabdus euzebyi]|uniref:3'-5' exonuclease DinG n=1 Tax=Salirhabdus euzebyi TaxID=394506 RepID=A0A841Q1N3_9BACI|nr:ATP-dependent DNA helicase DinG [Salirhabdus euzebyi]MBB6452233.1 ATP-dependent DNA helicase DinG [Salirhabdus euzebyi]